MNNEKLNILAEKIIVKSLPKDTYGNPLIILMVVGIIVNCIRVIQECNKSNATNLDDMQQQIKTLCYKKSWFTKMRLKKIIRKHMNKEDYKICSNILTDAILTQGETLTEEELYTLLEASNV